MSYSLCMEDDIDGLECLVRSLRCSLTTSRFSGPFFEMILKHLICYGCNAMIIRNKYKAHLLFKILVSGFIHNLTQHVHDPFSRTRPQTMDFPNP